MFQNKVNVKILQRKHRIFYFTHKWIRLHRSCYQFSEFYVSIRQPPVEMNIQCNGIWLEWRFPEAHSESRQHLVFRAYSQRFWVSNHSLKNSYQTSETTQNTIISVRHLRWCPVWKVYDPRYFTDRVLNIFEPKWSLYFLDKL